MEQEKQLFESQFENQFDLKNIQSEIKDPKNEVNNKIQTIDELNLEIKELNEAHKKELLKRDEKEKTLNTYKSSLLARIESLENEIKRKDQQIKGLNGTLDEYHQENEKHKEELDCLIKKLHKIIKDLKSRIRHLEYELVEKNIKIEKTEEELKACKLEIEHFKDTNQKYLSEHDQNTEKIKNLELILLNNDEIIDSLKTKDKEEYERHNKELEERIAKEKKLEYELNQLTLKIEEHEAEDAKKDRLLEEVKANSEMIEKEIKTESQAKDEIINMLKSENYEYSLKVEEIQKALIQKTKDYERLASADKDNFWDMKVRELEQYNQELLQSQRAILIELNTKENLINKLKNQLVTGATQIPSVQDSISPGETQDNIGLIAKFRAEIVQLQQECINLTTNYTRKSADGLKTENEMLNDQKTELIDLIKKYEAQLEDLLTKISNNTSCETPVNEQKTDRHNARKLLLRENEYTKKSVSKKEPHIKIPDSHNDSDHLSIQAMSNKNDDNDINPIFADMTPIARAAVQEKDFKKSRSYIPLKASKAALSTEYPIDTTANLSMSLKDLETSMTNSLLSKSLLSQKSSKQLPDDTDWESRRQGHSLKNKIAGALGSFFGKTPKKGDQQ